MPANVQPARRTSAPNGGKWAHICAAAVAVIRTAIDRGELDDLRVRLNGTSVDTLGRMLADANYGGWTAARVEGVSEYEQRRLRAASIVDAQSGRIELPRGDAAHVERLASRQISADATEIAGFNADLADGNVDRRECMRRIPELRAEIARRAELLAAMEARVSQ